MIEDYKDEFPVCPRCDKEWDVEAPEALITLTSNCGFNVNIFGKYANLELMEESCIHHIEWDLKYLTCHHQMIKKDLSRYNNKISNSISLPYLDYKITLDKLKKILLFI